MADGEQIARRLLERFPTGATATGAFRDQHWVELKPGALLEVCRWLREDSEADYDFLADVTAVHWPDEPQPIEIIYQLYSYRRNDRLRLKLRTSLEGPVPSLVGLWKSADWNERETYDMFGIQFAGHPDLRRILMPEDYTDFPLRKEFALFRG